ncbi:MAG: hypothetical protein EOO01_15785 [Chitinophagaceae bacterium]|nr:MAG: hypothetical protein EOO01_15785 [Chitinophagaceae bacterium]
MEQSNNLFELQVDHQGTAFLREIAKWAKFLAIVNFVVIGLILLSVLFAGSTISAMMASSYGEAGAAAGTFAGTFIMIVMVGMLLIGFFPTWYLFKFATRMQVALRNNDQDTLNASFESLKSSFKFIGILTIIVLSFYAILFLIGLAAGAARF